MSVLIIFSRSEIFRHEAKISMKDLSRNFFLDKRLLFFVNGSSIYCFNKVVILGNFETILEFVLGFGLAFLLFCTRKTISLFAFQMGSSGWLFRVGFMCLRFEHTRRVPALGELWRNVLIVGIRL